MNFVSALHIKEMGILPRVSLIEEEKAKFLVMSTGDLISTRLFTQGLWEDHTLGISKIFL